MGMKSIERFLVKQYVTLHCMPMRYMKEEMRTASLNMEELQLEWQQQKQLIIQQLRTKE